VVEKCQAMAGYQHGFRSHPLLILKTIYGNVQHSEILLTSANAEKKVTLSKQFTAALDIKCILYIMED